MNTTEPTWFKSSYSGTEGDNCVELATRPDAIHNRDSKRKHDNHFTVTPHTWTAFLNTL